MNTGYYVDLARRGLRMPIGTDLVLHEEHDPESVRRDGAALGAVVERAARRYRTPLAVPLMDLALEKADLLSFLGVQDVERHRFPEPPSEALLESVAAAGERPFPETCRAAQNAIRHIAERTDLLPIGMLIGPFSLMTRLVQDPITPLALAGAGTTPQESGIRLVERTLALALETVLRAARAQMECGARAMIVCEPAASKAYISPRQLRAGSDIFERFVLSPNRRLRDLLARHDVDLIFHNCGELTDDMVRQFAVELRPAVMSLGGSRRLWHDATLVPEDVVLFGNLPTKSFYSDSVMPLKEVRRIALELLSEMAATGHPHILGSECDVLHVSDAGGTIRAKVDLMLAVQPGA